MGSFIVAHLLKEHLECTKHAILIGPVIKNKNKATLARTLKYSMRMIKKFDLSEAMLKKILETRLSIYIIAKFLNLYQFNRELLDTYNLMSKKKMRKEAYTQMTISCSDYNLTETVIKLTVPTLLLYGRSDKISSPAFARKNVTPLNKNLKVASIPRAGHIVPLEQPAAVARTIAKFLNVPKGDSILDA